MVCWSSRIGSSAAAGGASKPRHDQAHGRGGGAGVEGGRGSERAAGKRVVVRPQLLKSRSLVSVSGGALPAGSRAAGGGVGGGSARQEAKGNRPQVQAEQRDKRGAVGAGQRGWRPSIFLDHVLPEPPMAAHDGVKERQRWTADEEEALRKGVEAHGEGAWQKIISMAPALRNRTQVRVLLCCTGTAHV